MREYFSEMTAREKADSVWETMAYKADIMAEAAQKKKRLKMGGV